METEAPAAAAILLEAFEGADLSAAAAAADLSAASLASRSSFFFCAIWA